MLPADAPRGRQCERAQGHTHDDHEKPNASRKRGEDTSNAGAAGAGKLKRKEYERKLRKLHVERRARLIIISHLLDHIRYKSPSREKVKLPKRKIGKYRSPGSAAPMTRSAVERQGGPAGSRRRAQRCSRGKRIDEQRPTDRARPRNSCPAPSGTGRSWWKANALLRADVTAAGSRGGDEPVPNDN
jgi:hypothetical protein